MFPVRSHKLIDIQSLGKLDKVQGQVKGNFIMKCIMSNNIDSLLLLLHYSWPKLFLLLTKNKGTKIVTKTIDLDVADLDG